MKNTKKQIKHKLKNNYKYTKKNIGGNPLKYLKKKFNKLFKKKRIIIFNIK